MAAVIDGYECVLNGEKGGVDYLIEVIDRYRITDDEIIYLVYMAADIVARRSSVELAFLNCGSD